MLLKGILVISLITLVTSTKKSFDGFQVFRVHPTSEHQKNALLSLQESDKFDFWSEIRTSGCDIMVAPEFISEFTFFLRKENMEFKVMIENVQILVDAEEKYKAKKGTRMSWDVYHDLDDVMAFIDESIEHDFVSKEVIGQSYLGKDMVVVKVNTTDSPKPKVWLDFGIHSREWISTALGTYILNQLTNEYEANKNVVDAFDWYLVLAHNPDGYEHTWTSNRMWRKTLQPNEGTNCVGADPNRNWDFHWMENGGASANPCSELFAGPIPFSESETKSVSDYILSFEDPFHFFVTVHSYSQMWLSPWGYTYESPENYANLTKYGMAGVNALQDVHGTQYQFGTSAQVIYINSGPSDDWALGAANIPLSYTLELRDTGEYGFLLPADQIIPCSEETWAGLSAMFQLYIDENLLQ